MPSNPVASSKLPPASKPRGVGGEQVVPSVQEMAQAGTILW
jgi:hypothetical protein